MGKVMENLWAKTYLFKSMKLFWLNVIALLSNFKISLGLLLLVDIFFVENE